MNELEFKDILSTRYTNSPFEKVVPFEKEDLQENGIIKGYGSTFGGKPDSYGDIIAKGAFAESILGNGRGGMGISMLYQHDASRPTGVWDIIMEDSRGLKMEGRLAMKTQLGSENYELLKMGALKGLSIGFDLPRTKDGKVDPAAYEVDEKKGTRLLKKINLWETSIVTFPANTRARVTGVKSLKDVTDVRDFEHALRDLGLSKSQSVYVASLCKPSLSDSGKGGAEELLEALNATIADIKNEKSVADELLGALKFVNNMLT